ncbi:hypothetical protein [Virgibacillus halodenitrificans]|uniref:hypothetical protein n=1 Tax=Virgibacillus halodenitrificans TaxID=1482 RepID=UPI000EF53AB0|nr:hypothetical protein [Virgibacillus halodenitrificans]
MNTLNHWHKDRINNAAPSLKEGITFFAKANFILLIFLFLFISRMDYKSLGGDELTISFLIIVSAELFIITLSIFTWRSPRKKVTKQKPFSKNEMLGMLIAIIILFAFSSLFVVAGLPIPTTLIMLILITNFMFALYSLLFHNVAILIYESNVHASSGSIISYVFKYIAIAFSGLNYFVQTTLRNTPLLVNKLFAVVFVILLLWENSLVLFYFDNYY